MRKPPDVLVVPTGTANLAAVIACFRRLGAEAAVSCDADRIAEADRVVPVSYTHLTLPTIYSV